MYANTTVQVLSPNRDNEFFEILVGVLEGDTLVLYLFIIALNYAMRQANENESNPGFTLYRPWSRQHSAEVICDNDFADISKQAQLLLS